MQKRVTMLFMFCTLGLSLAQHSDLQKHYVAIVEQVPSFAGVYFDLRYGEFTIALVDFDQLSPHERHLLSRQAKQATLKVLGAHGFDPDHPTQHKPFAPPTRMNLQVANANYSWQQLQEWQNSAFGLLRHRGVIGMEVDIPRNALVLTLTAPELMEMLQPEAAQLGIPPNALLYQVTP